GPGRVLILHGGRNPDGVNAHGPQPRGKVGQISRPVIGIIIVPVIPPETLQDNFGVPRVRQSGCSGQTNPSDLKHDIPELHVFSCNAPCALRQNECGGLPNFVAGAKFGSAGKPSKLPHCYTLARMPTRSLANAKPLNLTPLPGTGPTE